MSLLHRRHHHSRKHQRKHQKAGRRKAPKVAGKCLKACPRHIRLKCRVVNAAGDKTCNLTVPGFYKAKGLNSKVAGEKVGSIIKTLRAKNCAVPTVHRN